MKYVIKVPQDITYATVRVVYEEAFKLGIFTPPLYERYYREPHFTRLSWGYLGHSPTLILSVVVGLTLKLMKSMTI